MTLAAFAIINVSFCGGLRRRSRFHVDGGTVLRQCASNLLHIAAHLIVPRRRRDLLERKGNENECEKVKDDSHNAIVQLDTDFCNGVRL